MSESTLHPYWHGMLCDTTVNDIAARMNAVLHGRFFAIVEANSYDENSDRFLSIDVRTSQRLIREVSRFDGERDRSHLTWSTTSLSMGVSSEAKTQQDARGGHRLDYVHFNFEPRKFVIDHFAPAGYRLRWIFAVESHDEED